VPTTSRVGVAGKHYSGEYATAVELGTIVGEIHMDAGCGMDGLSGTDYSTSVSISCGLPRGHAMRSCQLFFYPLFRVGSVGEKWVKSYCSTFHCYLTKIIQLWTN
jgi:hypothetical protein